MADTVQYHMEQMLPELQDLEQKGLFTKEELRRIIKKRNQFEYNLKRNAALKIDFLRYIDYELKVEGLRKLRKKKIVKSKAEKKGSLSDHSIIRRVRLIYVRALQKFRGDLALWNRFFEFCRSQGGIRALQKAIANALRLHPTVPGLWIYAAAFEFEDNGNTSAARTLMQQGLRMCPGSQLLWHEYFRMELLYVQKVRARREVLGLSAPPKASDYDSTKEQPKRPGVTDGSIHVVGEQGSVASGSLHPDLDALSHAVAMTVYQSAVRAVADNPSFRLGFLGICRALGVPDAIEQAICDSVGADFPISELVRDFMCRRQHKSSAAIKAYRAAIEDVPTVTMFEKFAAYLGERLHDASTVAKDQGGKDPGSRAGRAARLCDELAGLLQAAASKGLRSERLATAHAALLMQGGDPAGALMALEKECQQTGGDGGGGSGSGSGGPWPGVRSLQLWLSLLCRGGAQGKTGSQASAAGAVLAPAPFIWKLVVQALQGAPLETGDGALPLWLQAVEVCISHGVSLDTLRPTLEGALCGKGNGVAGEDVAAALVDAVLLRQGVDSARTLYSKLLSLPRPGLALFVRCVEIELAQDEGVQLTPVTRRLLDSALELYGQSEASEPLWLEYCRRELAAVNLEHAKKIYGQAVKALADPSGFVANYQELVSMPY
eukprot:jgi/Mesvir1/5375/Mv15455-RA.1